MAESALALDDDHVGVLRLEGAHHLVLHLARAELRHEGVEGHAVPAALDDRGLTGADEHGPDADRAEGIHQQDGGGALADGAVGAEHGDARAGHGVDAARVEVQLGGRLRPADVEDGDAREQRRGGELDVVGEELVQPVDDVHAAGDALEQHEPLSGREQSVGGGDAADQVVGHRAVGGDGGVEIGHDRDARRGPVEHVTGVAAGERAVDDAHDLVALAAAHEAVGGLAVLLAELALAVDDRRDGAVRQRCGALGVRDRSGRDCSGRDCSGRGGDGAVDAGHGSAPLIESEEADESLP